jgi:hypothetical protein
MVNSGGISPPTVPVEKIIKLTFYIMKKSLIIPQQYFPAFITRFQKTIETRRINYAD